jgi:hypothetical protein
MMQILNCSSAFQNLLFLVVICVHNQTIRKKMRDALERGKIQAVLLKQMRKLGAPFNTIKFGQYDYLRSAFSEGILLWHSHDHNQEENCASASSMEGRNESTCSARVAHCVSAISEGKVLQHLHDHNLDKEEKKEEESCFFFFFLRRNQYAMRELQRE